MKTLMLAAAASLAFAGAAFAQDPDSETITINGENPAKCGVSAENTTVTLGDDVISDEEGRVESNLSRAIADALDGAEVRAFCTGAQNGVVLGRTALTTGNGDQLPSGFNQAIGYDIAININGATRADGTTPLEGSSDGSDGTQTGPGAPNNGNFVSAFGASGQGARVNFRAEAPAFATSDGLTGMPARDDLEAGRNNNRLAAGDYTGEVRIDVIPGV